MPREPHIRKEVTIRKKHFHVLQYLKKEDIKFSHFVHQALEDYAKLHNIKKENDQDE